MRIITVMDGEYRGNLLYTSDSSLVICEGNGCYDWRTESVLSFSYSDIKKIVVMKEGKGRKGSGWGFLIGAAIGAASVLSSNDYCQSPDSGPDCRRTMAIIGGIFKELKGLY